MVKNVSWFEIAKKYGNISEFVDKDGETDSWRNLCLLVQMSNLDDDR